MKSEKIKEIVKEKYSRIACNHSSCCPSDGGVSSVDYTVFTQDYNDLQGYFPEADLGLGCGLPTEFAKIKKGDIVIDLGSGAGNDCFVAAHLTGEQGRVIGLDFSEEMVRKANKNAEKLGLAHVRFFQSDIEDLIAPSFSADVVISNCVLNLVPDKKRVFSEIFRVLKSQGHFSISDIVLEGELPEKIRNAVELYCGCVSGAIQKSEYLEIIKATGFLNIEIQREVTYDIPDETLTQYLNSQEIDFYKQSGIRMVSINVYGEKPYTCLCCQ